MADRVHALKSLVALDRPLPEIIEALHQFPWDSDDDLVTLKLEDIAAILDRLRRGEFSHADVESWANAIESREDIGFDGANEGPIKDAIFQLANPDLSGPVTVEFVRERGD